MKNSNIMYLFIKPDERLSKLKLRQILPYAICPPQGKKCASVNAADVLTDQKKLRISIYFYGWFEYAERCVM